MNAPVQKIMSIQKIRFSKLVMFSTAVVLLIGLATAGKTQDETASAQESEVAPQIILAVPNFKGASDREVARLIDSVEEQQNFIRRTLLEQLRDKNLSPFARTQAIFLLSNFSPDDETILVLVHNMNMIGVRASGDTSFAASPFVGFFARGVLARMGIPVERKILEIINTQRPTETELKENPYLSSYSFDPSETEGFADVLTQIEGKESALLKLQDGQTKAKIPTIKAQFQAVIEVVKKGAARPFNY